MYIIRVVYCMSVRVIIHQCEHIAGVVLADIGCDWLLPPSCGSGGPTSVSAEGVCMDLFCCQSESNVRPCQEKCRFIKLTFSVYIICRVLESCGLHTVQAHCWHTTS